MYWVEYYCPKQSPYWQRRATAIGEVAIAIREAMMIKPPMGWARVIDGYGQVVYSC